MRRFLNLIYGGGLALACLCLVAIAALVTVQVAGRVLDNIVTAFGGDAIGIAVPSIAEIGGFLLVAAVTLALAGTFASGGHVRVTMLAGRLPSGPAKFVNAIALILGTALAIWAAWHSGLQALDSFKFNSLSYGIVKIPLVIPQGAMTLGIALLAVALLDGLVSLLRGGSPEALKIETGEV